MASPSPGPSVLAVPNKLLGIWIQGEAAMPDWARFNVDTWRKFNPDAQVRVYGDADIVPVLQQLEAEDGGNNFAGLLAAYQGAGRCWVQKKDLACFALVYAGGGLFMDLDFQLQKSVQPLLSANTLVAIDCAPRHLGAPCASVQVFGAIPRHPVIAATLKCMVRTFNKYGTSSSTAPCKVMSVLDVANCWRRVFAAEQPKYMSTALQFFLEPGSAFGLDTDDARLHTYFRGDGYGFLTQVQGSWFTPCQHAYHRLKVQLRQYRRVILAVAVIIIVLGLLAVVGMEAYTVHRSRTCACKVTCPRLSGASLL